MRYEIAERCLDAVEFAEVSIAARRQKGVAVMENVGQNNERRLAVAMTCPRKE